MLTLSLACLALLGATADAQDQDRFRGRLSLNGTWQVATTQEYDVTPPPDGWHQSAVPGTQQSTSQGGTRWTWYRRQLEVPRGWQGRRVFLNLMGARYNARVLLDGKLIGQRLEGWTPFELELEDVEAGKTYQLDVSCQDWSATFDEGYAIPADFEGDTRRIGGGHAIAPIGGHFTYYGIWDDVWLESRPRVYLYDVAVRSSWREKRLTITGQSVETDARLLVGASVLDGDQQVLRLPPVSANGDWTLAAEIPDTIRWWSPEDPALYTLRVVLSRGDRVADVHEERIGFRELWAEGPDFYFNGVKRHLLATSTWPSSSPQTREEVRRNLEVIKAGNNVAFRLHTQPWQKRWLEEADEVGLMIIEEGALWCDGSGTYGYADQRFWDNTWIHLAGMVKRDRNHASLVMWSLENEILHCGAGRHYAETETKLAELGRRVKQLDPSHLITYESDHDPGGVADVVGLHYPHEMPANTDYPNTADWLSKTVMTGTEGDLMGSRRAAFHWDRKKPLYIGEYLWVPHGGYAPGTVFFGDEAYLDRTEYHVRAKAESWVPQTLAYRRAGVSGMCPWTCVGSGGSVDPRRSILYEKQKEAYEPVAAFAQNWDTRFFGGETVTRTFDVFNDSVETRELELAWTLVGTDAKGMWRVKLDPAGRATADIEVALPEVAERTELELAWVLNSTGKQAHVGRQTWSVFPRRPLSAPAGAQVLVLDPKGEWTRRAADEGLACSRLRRLADLPSPSTNAPLLVVAPGALTAEENPGPHEVRDSPRDGAEGGEQKGTPELPRVGEEDGEGPALASFLAGGGRALILEQDALRGLPLGVSLVEHASTMTFVQHAAHPALAGFQPDDFKWWRGDHYVTQKEIRRPTRGGAVPLLVSGSARGLDQSPVVEVPAGRGVAVLCQALVGQKMFSEPVARELFDGLLSYLAAATPRAPLTLLLTDSDAFAQRLDALGMHARRVKGFLAALGGTSPLVALHGGGERIEQAAPVLKSWLDAAPGATVYWHAPEPDTFAKVAEQLGIADLSIETAAGPVSVAHPSHPVFSGICREDLAFASAQRGDNWRKPFEPDPSVIDRALMPTASGTAVQRFEVEQMPLTGKIVVPSNDGKSVAFATVGEAAFTVEVPQAGLYPVTVWGSGSPAGGGWPMAVIRRGRAALARVTVNDREVKPYQSMIELPAGKSDLTIAFVNDTNIGGEDRNLYLDAVGIGRQPLADMSAELITLPAALAVIPVGKGRLVVDGVRWDSNKRNATQGMRYASALLSNLGATFTAPEPEPSWVPASAFELVGESGYFGKTDAELQFRAHGTCQAEFECVRAGTYEVVVRGYSNEVEGEWGKAEITLDGNRLGETELATNSMGVFPVGETQLAQGRHTVSVRFTNDVWRDGADRNLYVAAVGFRKED